MDAERSPTLSADRSKVPAATRESLSHCLGSGSGRWHNRMAQPNMPPSLGTSLTHQRTGLTKPMATRHRI